MRSTMTERWKKCGASRRASCFVSDRGRVVSVRRDRVKLSKQAVSGKNPSSNRLCEVVHVGKMSCVHQLVSEAFMGPLLPGSETKHHNDNTHNNRASNLCHGVKSTRVVSQRRKGIAKFKRSVKKGLTNPTVLEEFHPNVWVSHQSLCIQCIKDIQSKWESLSNSVSSFVDAQSISSSFFNAKARRSVDLIKGDQNEEPAFDFPLPPSDLERTPIQKSQW